MSDSAYVSCMETGGTCRHAKGRQVRGEMGGELVGDYSIMAFTQRGGQLQPIAAYFIINLILFLILQLLLKLKKGLALTTGHLQHSSTQHILGIHKFDRLSMKIRQSGELLDHLVAHRVEDIEEAGHDVVTESRIQLLPAQLPLLACN